MSIFYHQQEGLFHLKSKGMSYVIQLVNGYPVHTYWGQALRDQGNLSGMATSPDEAGIDRLPQEYPQYGTGDFRNPAYQVRLTDGTRITELAYKGHQIIQGKPALEGLPAVYTESEQEATTLELELADAYSKLGVVLSYTMYSDMNVMTRSVKFINRGSEPLTLLRALSMSVDLPAGDMDMIYLAGAWSREARIRRRRVDYGGTTIESNRGASSHQLNPFAALVRPETNEDQGEAFGFSFVYSGNFQAVAEKDSFDMTRFSMGLNSFDFTWLLNPGESFQTPEVVMVYSAEGLGGMSRTYHKLYRTRLCRGIYRDKERPILVNNWEATYFNFNTEKLVDIAKEASNLGIELFVLDDGWFGKRDDDHTSLGDWVEDRRKLPGGLNDLAGKINELGVKFGLWVEPEMISPVSELYQQHPDWCLHVPGRRRTELRWQLTLDLSRAEVRDYVYDALARIFSTVPISYIKWDMNRFMTEIGSAASSPERQSETAHRYMLGLYELLEKITKAFPHILFESCSSGGARFDPGMLYYMPQTWTSDDTDAVERLKIQYGTSLVYPVSTIGAHVSAVPNHQVGRMTPLTMRGDVAMSGNFGYELDLTKLTEEEKAIVKQQVADYKQHRSLVQQGQMYRLKSPFEGNETAWMFVSEDQSEALFFFFRVLAQPHPGVSTVRLNGLDPNRDYRISSLEQTFGGDRLMRAGLKMPQLQGDFASVWYKLEAL